MWGPVNEVVDLRYRPEVNTIGALAEPGPSEHAPFAEPIWTTTSEENGHKCNVKSSQVVGLRDRVAIIRALLHAISSPPPCAGYGAVNGVCV